MSGKALIAEEEAPPRQPAESTGLHGQNLGTHEGAGAQKRDRPLSLAWITDDLVAYTQEVWARRLERAIPEEEAIEMLVNVKRLAEAMMKAAAPEGGASR